MGRTPRAGDPLPDRDSAQLTPPLTPGKGRESARSGADRSRVSLPAQLPAVKFEFLTKFVPVLAVAGMVWCAWKVYENRESEIKTVLNSGWKFVLVAIFAVLGRGLLSV